MSSPQDADQTDMASMMTTMYQQVQALTDQMALLTQQVQDLSFQAPPVAAPPLSAEPVSTATSGQKIRAPKPYAGDPHACRGFLNQCEIQFEMAPQQYSTGRKKVAYVYSLLTGNALAWASPIWELRPEITRDYAAFRQDFRQVFDTPARQETASDSLLELSQRRRPVAQYTLAFRTIAAETRWDQESLVSVFWRGLTDSVKDELASQTRPGLLEELISKPFEWISAFRYARAQHQHPRFVPFRAPFPRFSSTTGPAVCPLWRLRSQCNLESSVLGHRYDKLAKPVGYVTTADPPSIWSVNVHYARETTKPSEYEGALLGC
ncbi:uncharacterized protein LOC142499531 [Ascaphus truei]|uniref:uncharacterized protein LOC142499531 n=1 Tax=Ascaphus truei TaxID=8439 RepID=UPI003F5AB245